MSEQLEKPEKQKNLSFDSSNIFEELSGNTKIHEEVQKQESENERSIFYYLKYLNSFFLTINILLFASVTLFGLYYYVQTTESSRNFSFLSPVCKFIISDVNQGSSCYSSQYLLSQETQKLENLEQMQIKQILPIFADLYSFENFRLSRKVAFLLDRSTNRLKPTEILASFDELKNRYTSVDKSEIVCYDIEITDENILSISCDVYSSDWDTRIVTFNDGIKTFKPGGGTSITRAASFINFLKKYDKSPFQVVSQNETFDSFPVQVPPYTQKTTIQLMLEYNTFNIQN